MTLSHQQSGPCAVVMYRTGCAIAINSNGSLSLLRSRHSYGPPLCLPVPRARRRSAQERTAAGKSGKVEVTGLYRQLYEAAGDIKPKNISVDTLSRGFAGSEIDRVQVYAFAMHMQALAWWQTAR
jgi:hypothetical protein